jgi:hypothetical protein
MKTDITEQVNFLGVGLLSAGFFFMGIGFYDYSDIGSAVTVGGAATAFFGSILAACREVRFCQTNKESEHEVPR